MSDKMINATGSQNEKRSLLKKIFSEFAHLFEPREVEVTFEGEGPDMRYTYVPVNHQEK